MSPCPDPVDLTDLTFSDDKFVHAPASGDLMTWYEARDYCALEALSGQGGLDILNVETVDAKDYMTTQRKNAMVSGFFSKLLIIITTCLGYVFLHLQIPPVFCGRAFGIPISRIVMVRAVMVRPCIHVNRGRRSPHSRQYLLGSG